MNLFSPVLAGENAESQRAQRERPPPALRATPPPGERGRIRQRAHDRRPLHRRERRDVTGARCVRCRVVAGAVDARLRRFPFREGLVLCAARRAAAALTTRARRSSAWARWSRAGGRSGSSRWATPFYDREAADRLDAPKNAPILGALGRADEWVWITGNHDPAPPAWLRRHGDGGDRARPPHLPP